jgi:hypothetical protein
MNTRLMLESSACLAAAFLCGSTVAQVVPAHLPLIIVHPQNRTISSWESASFEVQANGTPPLSYQWRSNGIPISGATSPTVYVPPLSPLSTNYIGYFDVLVSNAYGTVPSAVARLQVNPLGPGIPGEPEDQFACVGDTVYFWVYEIGGSTPNYQWRHNGYDLAGQTRDRLTLTNVSQADVGDYSVVLSNRYGMVTSRAARLVVDPAKPVIWFQPRSALVDEGNSITLFVQSFDCTPLSFQWRRNGTNLLGETDESLLLLEAGLDVTGDYDVVVSGLGGSATSLVATVVVTQSPPRIVLQPQSQTVVVGGWLQFTCLAEGSPPLGYQWLFNGEPIEGGTQAQLNFTVLSIDDGGDYSAVVTNRYGAVTSAVATLTVNLIPPWFIEQPVDQSLVAGQTLQLTAAANGSPPPELQWFFNGEALSWATNESLVIENIATNQAGKYSAVASNVAGSATSRVATVCVLSPGPLDRWEWRRPLPQGNDLGDIAWGNGVFVAVGWDGTRVTSRDGGTTWRDSGQDSSSTYEIAYGNGVFVALGATWRPVNSPLVSTRISTDGVHWVEAETSDLNGFAVDDLAYGNGRFVAVSGWGQSAVSSDGVQWTVATNAGPSGFDRVIFGHGVFVALTYDSDPSTNGPMARIALSSDGLSWTNVSLGIPSYLSDITWGDGQFVACGYVPDSNNYGPNAIFTSPDALAWMSHIQPPANYPITALAYGGGRYVAGSNDDGGVLGSSSDGIDWTFHHLPTPSEFYAVAWGEGVFVAAGNRGCIFSSRDGETWTMRSPGAEANLRSVTRGNGCYVAVGNEGLIFTSPPGVAWTQQPAATTNNLRSVTFGSGRFVAVGEGGGIRTNILTSTDGVTWTRQGPSASSLYSVTYAQGMFVAVGGQVLTSSDGLVWTNPPSPARDRLNAVTWGGGQFVAVGRNANIITSTNGTNWALRLHGEDTSFLQGVAYGNGRFVAAGQSSAVMTSSNGVSWQWQQVPAALWGYPDIEDVQFANGQFVVVGANGFLATSPDGLVWTRHATRCQNDLRSIHYAGGYLTAVGNNETILQSGFWGRPILRVRAVGSEGFEFSVDGEAGGSYVLQTSDDLLNWEDVFIFNNRQETTLFLDADAMFLTQRFYRVVSK